MKDAGKDATAFITNKQCQTRVQLFDIVVISIVERQELLLE